MKRASEALAQPPARPRPESPTDDVSAFCSMIKCDLRRIPLLERKKLMHKISGMIIEALEPKPIPQSINPTSVPQTFNQQPKPHEFYQSTFTEF